MLDQKFHYTKIWLNHDNIRWSLENREVILNSIYISSVEFLSWLTCKQKNLVLGSWSNTNLQIYPMHNNFLWELWCSRWIHLVKFPMYYLMSFLILKLQHTDFVPQFFFAVWLVINDVNRKITGLGKANGFCCQAGE